MERTSTPTASEVVASNVRAELARRNIPARDLALALGWSKAKASRRLSGQNPWTVDDVTATADFLSVPSGLLTTGLAA